MCRAKWSDMVGTNSGVGVDQSHIGWVNGSRGSWLTRVASARTRHRRLGRAFDELRIDVRGKQVLHAFGQRTVPETTPTRFDVIVASLATERSTEEAVALRALGDRLAPGGVLCMFVSLSENGLVPVREDAVWGAAGSIAHAGFDVLFAEGSRHVATRDTDRRRSALLGAFMDALQSVFSALAPRRFRERAEHLLDRAGLCPRQALVVARKRLAARTATH